MTMFLVFNLQEKIEQMKKDGTYMTKAQKEAKARAEAMLAALKEQGVEVPSKETVGEESRPRKVVYGKRERKKKKNQEEGQHLTLRDATFQEISLNQETSDRKNFRKNEKVSQDKIIDQGGGGGGGGGEVWKKGNCIKISLPKTKWQ